VSVVREGYITAQTNMGSYNMFLCKEKKQWKITYFLFCYSFFKVTESQICSHKIYPFNEFLYIVKIMLVEVKL